jgi:hypothetical protein
MQRAKEGAAVFRECYFRFRVTKKYLIYTCFFLSNGLVEPVRLVRFNRFQTLKTETEPDLFCDFLIG